MPRFSSGSRIYTQGKSFLFFIILWNALTWNNWIKLESAPGPRFCFAYFFCFSFTERKMLGSLGGMRRCVQHLKTTKRKHLTKLKTSRGNKTWTQMIGIHAERDHDQRFPKLYPAGKMRGSFMTWLGYWERFWYEAKDEGHCSWRTDPGKVWGPRLEGAWTQWAARSHWKILRIKRTQYRISTTYI